jgi:hypothetical protein
MPFDGALDRLKLAMPRMGSGRDQFRCRVPYAEPASACGLPELDRVLAERLTPFRSSGHLSLSAAQALVDDVL